ncbi:tRNA epoxyqueuosine(34) reductase QueG [Akkermansiaceae bacterium]|nr:tRNA epoxyqueuosine(34) reductase QueG [Akkermansiaceae bacterium]MDB4507963.1 tRNA epoxyqueuosine(34) reductase QueG [Akkermansiaceae bacterium]MDB4541545.1 tRNA epoxyqueuosine(34) reductase QueG [Akkermansiaceae bacterium]
MDPATIKSNIQFIARQLGFDDCRIAQAGRAPHADRYLEWLDEGQAGDMGWLERNVERRCDPREVLPGCQSVISLALNYLPAKEHPETGYRIAKYSWNDDYHDIIEEKLKDLDSALQDMGGQQRYYVDTGPILERDFASAAGLGWNGKSTVQIHKKLGTWFFLCELLTTLDLEPDTPSKDHCGKCTACIQACPTSAITGPRKMEATRCVSYLTIEHKGAIPVEFRKAMGDRIYGCDDCLDACPWNRFAKISRETRLHARGEIFEHSLNDFLKMSVEDFRATFAKSPIKRIKQDRFLRNVCVALGNTGTEEDLPALKEVRETSDLVKEHADWAISEIMERGRPALR